MNKVKLVELFEFSALTWIHIMQIFVVVRDTTTSVLSPP
jgi:hypothetical protein